LTKINHAYAYGGVELSKKTVSDFLQLPIVWKYPILKPLTSLLALLPYRFSWKDADQSQHRKLIRFSKEKMLLATARKA
jgi:hypothetical protein